MSDNYVKMKIQKPWEAHARRLRIKFPLARLSACYDKGGEFSGWKITNGFQGAALSGLHQDDEAAWEKAAALVTQSAPPGMKAEKHA